MNRRRVFVALMTLVAAGAGTTRAADAPEDSITVKVGQEIHVSFTLNGDALVAPKTVPDGNGPDPVVTIQVTQSGPTRTVLVTNGFARSLGYRAKSRKRGSRKETELPTVAVRAGQQSVLSVGEPFDELVLFEFYLQG